MRASHPPLDSMKIGQQWWYFPLFYMRNPPGLRWPIGSKNSELSVYRIRVAQGLGNGGITYICFGSMKNFEIITEIKKNQLKNSGMWQTHVASQIWWGNPFKAMYLLLRAGPYSLFRQNALLVPFFLVRVEKSCVHFLGKEYLTRETWYTV
jgi:hypothetical protein